ncbi:ABC transporter permease [Clostridium thermosuccinogenes]|jgi:simple sugar transport system permease protein|uniref:ABC transporter permease n=1 Tax=Clostridium thermosuccinogenes TaxID=84032 RepID=A0A2K2FCF1_9CLOT|nr:ABC transporter permease [Pseudoclostridium thermosuccinogenes]AUS98282.1 ABC transporter permease [Pseudoclostridium thermosuccinogenes]PNT91070.1 ABC transporter permease [Pseudoclostridium thermosuccinogenes]PNT96456.1 ABC transporter permease [Pseudoclostridium thermosuccinogenes]PNT98164.1 ABC transporter permease [Pseudoclostridium thermosuccinogenes]
MTAFITSICAAAIVYAVSILYAAIGEIFSQRAGIMNLGIEGIMLMGAVSGFLTVYNTNNLVLAFLAVILVGAVLGLVFAFLTVTLGADQTVCGMAFLIFGSGLSGFIGKNVTGIASAVKFEKINIPFLSDIPVVGDIFFKQDLLVYLMYLIVPLSIFYIYRTRPGMILRALGENPAALDAAGINVFALRYAYVIFGCAMTAISGACISLSYTNFWNEGMTGGKGWIAFSLVAFSGWNPAGAALGALLFGAISIIGINMQIYLPGIPSQFYSMLPYIATVVALIISTGSFRRKHTEEPAALCQKYDREAR